MNVISGKPSVKFRVRVLGGETLLNTLGKGFVEQNMYEDHMNVHMGKKPHICHVCPNAAYASKGNLAAHLRATHQGRKRKPKTHK